MPGFAANGAAHLTGFPRAATQKIIKNEHHTPPLQAFYL
jgi:hypothetical protein